MQAFAPIVDSETFERAQAALPRRADTFWSDEEILRKLRRLLAAKGYLSDSLIRQSRGLPATTTLHRHFGTYRQLYRAVGYQLPPQDLYKGRLAEPTIRLRRKLVKHLARLFPDHMRVTNPARTTRSILEIDRSFFVGVLICVSYLRTGSTRHWVVRPTRAERENITLLCKINPSRTRIVGYHLLPKVDIPHRSHVSYKDDPWLSGGIALGKLSDFYHGVQRLRTQLRVPHESSSLMRPQSERGRITLNR